MEKRPEPTQSNLAKRSIGRSILDGMTSIGESLRSVFYMGPIVPELPYRLSERDYRQSLAEMDRLDMEANAKDWQATGSDMHLALRQIEQQIGQKEE